ncbi:LA2681 family HEPN domain-containing protein [Bartonella sp. HY038]|uniref:LA2681 family HEPN domain-containing protein n=1 Tax=Bartonella sp. HY038 TaxID=2759660 RepID=UPI0015FB5D1D|nr:LA2681 family HEPN domain-containing protein [Bartonella sp. HY038]
MINDDYERAVITLHAHDSFLAVSANNAIFDADNKHLIQNASMQWVRSLASAVNVKIVRSIQNLDIGPKNQTNKELAYRNWCLDNRLFLSPINDLGPYWAAAYDDLVIPTISEKTNERTDGHLPPPIFGFFNQIKQEYVSVRFTLFEGLNSNKIHYSDHHDTLSDTLDYLLYSLASERIRMAFRIAYSLLDKIAYLVNHYWALNKKLGRISFKNIWMVENKKHLLPQFENSDNLPLRGLFWLSKELFDEDIKATTSADARDLHTIRNALEHSYLRVIEGWAKPFMSPETYDSGLGITIGSDELESKAICIMQIARMAILYVSFAIGIEEKKRKEKHPAELSFEMPLFDLKTTRKKRPPTPY